MALLLDFGPRCGLVGAGLLHSSREARFVHRFHFQDQGLNLSCDAGKQCRVIIQSEVVIFFLFSKELLASSLCIFDLRVPCLRFLCGRCTLPAPIFLFLVFLRTEGNLSALSSFSFALVPVAAVICSLSIHVM